MTLNNHELCEIDVVEDSLFSVLEEEEELPSVQTCIAPWRIIEAYQDEKQLRKLLKEYYDD